MATYETPSGLRVVDNRRGLPPRDNPPNDNDVADSINPVPTTVNPPGTYNPISVGPDASEGFGNTHVMYPADNAPPQAQAWSGWPVEWATPSFGYGAEWVSRLDTVFAAVDLNSSVLSTMPPYVVHGTTPEAPASWLINPEPMVYNSWADFAKEIFWSYEIVGEVFIYATARFADGFPRRFMMLNPAFVNVEMAGGRRVYSIGGADVTADILHLRYASWPGDAHGHGPLESAGARLLSAEALSRYATGLATSGGVPWAVLKYPKRLTTAQMQKIQSDWVNARRSAMGVPAVLADGVELQPFAVPPKDMMLAELAKWNESRLSVLMGVPPFLLGLPSGGDSMTYSNVTSLFDFHWRAYLRPKASAVMTALSNWLLPSGWGVELNRDEYVRPGLGERAAAYQTLVNIGALTPDEVRVMERFGGPIDATPVNTTGAAVLSDASNQMTGTG